MFDLSVVRFPMLTDIAVYTDSHYGQGSGEILLHPHCNGGESGLLGCDYALFPNCSHDYDAAVNCTPCMSSYTLFLRTMHSIFERCMCV